MPQQKEYLTKLLETGAIVDTDFWGNVVSVEIPKALAAYGEAVSESIATGGASTVIEAGKKAIEAAVVYGKMQEIKGDRTLEEALPEIAEYFEENGIEGTFKQEQKLGELAEASVELSIDKNGKYSLGITFNHSCKCLFLSTNIITFSLLKSLF